MEINNTLNTIDEFIFQIRSKDDLLSSFGVQSLYQFELRMFLCLDIVRYELQTIKQISDQTADAIRYLFVFGAFEYYHRDYPEIHKQAMKLSYTLFQLNPKLEKLELPGKVGPLANDWQKYFKTKIPQLIFNP